MLTGMPGTWGIVFVGLIFSSTGKKFKEFQGHSDKSKLPVN
jgi:hypothetical protein